MKLKNIQINHPKLGQIVINSEVDKEINELIGTVTGDFAKHPVYYHADISENRDKSYFNIERLSVISPETIDVGLMKTNGGSKSCVTLITNRKISDCMTVYYPSGIISIEYNLD